MKTHSRFLPKVLTTATLAALCLLAAPQSSHARDRGKDKHDKHDSRDHRSHRDDDDRRRYLAHPRTTFTLSLGNGYRGRGYYYGPPNAPYYYERSEVRYYATREAAPREYYTREMAPAPASGAAIQRALARRGYYRGTIDGDLGPRSRSAIAQYQSDHGMRPTGAISPGLLRSLGL